MNILFISHYYYPHIGGVEKHVREVGKRLVKKGYKLTVVTEKFDHKLKERDHDGKIKILRLPYPHIKYIGLLVIWFWFIKNLKLIKDVDIVHIHDVFIWYLPFRFLFPTKKVFLTIHGWEGIYPIPFSSFLQKKLACLLSKKTIFVGKYLEKYYKQKADQILYGATDIKCYANIKKQRNRIIYLGRLSHDTGLAIFLKTFESLKGYKIVFYGQGELKTRCQKYGRVIENLHNSLPVLAKADICFASGYLSILEAFSQKCLVVVAYQNNLKKNYFSLTPFYKWMVVDKSEREITKKLNFVLSHKKVKRKMVDLAFEWAKVQSWNKISEIYIKLWYQKRA